MVSQLDFVEVANGLSSAGYWFLAVIALWIPLYALNTLTWWLIIKDGGKRCADDGKISFWWLYKITVSAFALNYITPGGLVGGEPYRIMELAPKIGTERATSSVLLFVMTFMSAHFCFWALSIPLYLLTQTLTVPMAFVIGAMTLFCAAGMWFFAVGYKKGLAVRGMSLLRHLPFIRRWAGAFIDSHRVQLDTIDMQIASLHKQSKRTFATALAVELAGRIASALEVMFVLLVLMPHPNFFDCILILSLTSLFANLLFFIPLQLGGREGGFLLSMTCIGLSASAAVFVALIIRLRELIWTGVGLLLINLSKQTS